MIFVTFGFVNNSGSSKVSQTLPRLIDLPITALTVPDAFLAGDEKSLDK